MFDSVWRVYSELLNNFYTIEIAKLFIVSRGRQKIINWLIKF